MYNKNIGGIMKTAINSIILIFSLLAISHASHEMIIQVVQPVVIEEGIRKINYPYIYYGNFIADLKVRLTCEQNFIKTESGVENRNLASILNFKIKIIGEPFGDTLKTELTLPKEENVILNNPNITFEEVINATIECMIENASKNPNYKIIKIKVIGEKKYIKYSKEYKL